MEAHEQTDMRQEHSKQHRDKQSRKNNEKPAKQQKARSRKQAKEKKKQNRTMKQHRPQVAWVQFHFIRRRRHSPVARGEIRPRIVLFAPSQNIEAEINEVEQIDLMCTKKSFCVDTKYVRDDFTLDIVNIEHIERSPSILPILLLHNQNPDFVAAFGDKQKYFPLTVVTSGRDVVFTWLCSI
ncbi:hypothetical protein Tco_0368408 [Tanacetum coccineum]